ncbi:MAG: flagellar motor protein MotB, partial [Rickettsiales bacterium]
NAEYMAADDQTIVIKRIKKVAGGHHGGAWKVAYADFVTAMMAFFLLLWLLSSTTTTQKMGLAEYFTPTIGIKDSMGIGVKGGLHASEEGKSKNDLVAVGLVMGQVKQGDVVGPPNPTKGESDPDAEATSNEKVAESTEDSEQMQATAEEIKQALEQEELVDYKNNVILQDTPEGLKIDMIDDAKKPMFIPGGAVLTEMGKKVLDNMARMVAKTPNNIAIKGHTDSPSSISNPQYSIWELSADRANSARRMLATTQLEPERVVKVMAMADKELLVPQEPSSPRNRRITIVILRGSYFRDSKEMPTTRSILSVTKAVIKKDEPKETEKKEDDNKEQAPTGGSIFNNIIQDNK